MQNVRDRKNSNIDATFRQRQGVPARLSDAGQQISSERVKTEKTDRRRSADEKATCGEVGNAAAKDGYGGKASKKREAYSSSTAFSYLQDLSICWSLRQKAWLFFATHHENVGS
jgi:hypothetical protein